jgi:hypothetical protein
MLTTRDDCCELSLVIAGPQPVGWCGEENLDPVTLACSACEEPCETRPTFTPAATPTPSPTASSSSCDVTNPCPQGAFCELPAGACATALDSGVCVDVPSVCFDTFEVVCGCDGLTYGNDCIRRAARVQKAFDGACPDEECSNACDCYATRTFATSCPLECANCGNFWTCEEGRCLEHCGVIPFDVCDQLCFANDACGVDEYCRKPVGQCAGLGACEARPVGCPDVVDPVCGCDGKTYSNECDAADAGVAIEHRGACAQVCGTIAGLTCPKGQFCELPAAMCDVADLAGQCLDVPDACPAVVDPVCGCDGLTYDNDCERQRAQIPLDQPGPCGGK